MDTNPVTNLLERLAAMDFAHRLAAGRQQRGMTQQTLADTVGVRVTQPRRFEAATNQPTLEVLHALAVALAVSADNLVFDPDERGPKDESLRLHLAAVDQRDPDDSAGIRALIDGALLRHQARRLAQTS